MQRAIYTQNLSCDLLANCSKPFESKVCGWSLNLSRCVTQVPVLSKRIYGCLNLSSSVIQVSILSKCISYSLNLASGVIQVPELLKCSVIPFIEHDKIKILSFKQAIIFIGTFPDLFYCLVSFSQYSISNLSYKPLILVQQVQRLFKLEQSSKNNRVCM